MGEILLTMEALEQPVGFGEADGTYAYNVKFDTADLDGNYNLFAEFDTDKTIFRANEAIAEADTEYVFGIYYSATEVTNLTGTVKVFKVS